MPKLYFGSRGGVYYRKKGRRVYINRFGDKQNNVELFNKMYKDLIGPILNEIITKKILPENYEEIREKIHEDFKCGHDKLLCLQLIERYRLLLKIMIDNEKWNFFVDAYNKNNNFNENIYNEISYYFLKKFNKDNFLINEEKNVLQPVLLDNYRNVRGNSYWSLLPEHIGKKYKKYGETLHVLSGYLVEIFSNNGFKSDIISGLINYLLTNHPNTSKLCDWTKSHKYNKENDSLNICPICHFNFKEGDLVITLLCGENETKETIHKECLGQNTLPNCYTNREPVMGCF